MIVISLKSMISYAASITCRIVSPAQQLGGWCVPYSVSMTLCRLYDYCSKQSFNLSHYVDTQAMDGLPGLAQSEVDNYQPARLLQG